MKRKPLFLAFSDFHTAKWKQFNDNNGRTCQPHKIMLILKQKCIDLGINLMLFPGDWNDHPKHMDNEVMEVNASIAGILNYNEIDIVGIDGNHDFSRVNSIQKDVKGFFNHLQHLNKHFICVNFESYDTPETRIHGIPYINGNADYKKALKERIKQLHKTKKNILLIHRDLPGAVEPNGIQIGEMDDQKTLKKLFRKFDLVLSGHIHKPQKIKKLGSHVYMLGATNQQRRSDMGTRMGYWIGYSDMSMEFMDLHQPEFKYYKDGEEPGNSYDYWIKLPPERNLEVGNNSNGKFKSNQKRDVLVKNYLKVKGIKNKKKLHLLMDLIND